MTAGHRRALGAVALVALLAGCAAKPAGPGAESGISYRNPAAVLAGTTRFDADRFAGDWVTRACIGPCPPARSFRVSQAGAVTETTETGERGFLVEGPGILRATTGSEALVVMWVDDGFRTAAIGTSTGRSAAIISRERAGGADRNAAAREILDFNGWDISQLRDVTQ